jgi:hypothetical protein
MLRRKKTINRGQDRELDVDDEGKSKITFACFNLYSHCMQLWKRFSSTFRVATNM